MLTWNTAPRALPLSDEGARTPGLAEGVVQVGSAGPGDTGFGFQFADQSRHDRQHLGYGPGSCPIIRSRSRDRHA